MESVRLEKFLVAVGVAGVIAHVGGANLGEVQGAVVAKVLFEAKTKAAGWILQKSETGYGKVTF